jgi:putative tryptophan/tyrosine transport system substrate-binding protein
MGGYPSLLRRRANW